MSKGLVHVYYGNGKGKTTAGIGLAVRAVGQGMRVLVIQFLKGEGDYGERKYLESRIMNHESRTIIKNFGRKGLVNPKKLEKADFDEVRKGIEIAEKEVKRGKWDMIILDEVGVAVKFGLTSENDVVKLIKSRPKELELVLTGRWMGEKTIKLADYVTEMREIKHPYKKGVRARKGIEY